ncbi:kunitz trypsin inhibitor 5-like [Primulina huaijiensis]|uniref:kunitz trypsin inhibitor 5-like n=1 Tax=Primulina huaijiensis TaxID=1492673 RepID=UPI003CC7139E
MNSLISYIILLILIHGNHYMVSTEGAEELPAPVVDLAGNNLREGTRYYILPLIRGRGGGVTLSSTRNKTCPLSVVQAPFELQNGLPLTFSPVKSEKGGFIRESTDLNIKFSAASICVQSTVWKLDQYDESSKQYFITTGGVEGNPGPGTISNWFKIEKYQSDYKLVYCPTVCNFCKVICRDVGIFFEDGKRRLALSDTPFVVMFKKV